MALGCLDQGRGTALAEVVAAGRADVHSVRVGRNKFIGRHVSSDEERGLAADEPALLHRGAVAVVQDVHVGQVLERRPVDAGVVVLRSVEAEQDVSEWLAILVEGRDLSEGFPVLRIDTLDVSPVDQ
ncbi:hypothetical protein D3C77_486110 [compost metagenome]